MTYPVRAEYFTLLYYRAAENMEYPSIPADIMKGSDFSVLLINIIKTKIKLCYFRIPETYEYSVI